MLERDHRGVGRHRTGLPERGGVGMLGQRVQPGAFLDQHLRGDTPGHPVHAVVDLPAELGTGALQLGEAAVLSKQIRLGRHQVRFGDLHRVLAAALACRIGRHARGDRQPIVLAELEHLRVAHRYPGHVLAGHGLLVVGQPVGRHPRKQAQRLIDRGHHRRQRLIQQRQHDPKPAPRQPRAKQLRANTIHPWAITKVVLKPHPRLSHPGPVHPPAPSPIGRLGLGDSPPGRALRTGVSQRDQLLVGHIRADLAARTVHPFLQLLPIRIHQHVPPLGAPRGQLTPLPGGHQRRHRVMRTPRQLGGITQRARQIVSFQNFHDLLGRLHSSPPRELNNVWRRSEHPRRGPHTHKARGDEQQIQWANS